MSKLKSLVVYYSYEGNTETLVKEIEKRIDVDILKLVPIKEYKTSSLYRFMFGFLQVYKTKKPALEKYNLDLSKYDNIIIASPCWFGSFAPPINTFLNENKIINKNIYLLMCNGGNLRNTWKNYEQALKGNNIVSKIDFVYPIKNGIEDAKKKLFNWLDKNFK